VPGLWRYYPRLRLLTVMSITGEKRFVDIPEGRALARVHQHSGRLTQGQDPCDHHELQEGVVISALDGQPDPPRHHRQRQVVVPLPEIVPGSFA
jgi:hypothetical protein